MTARTNAPIDPTLKDEPIQDKERVIFPARAPNDRRNFPQSDFFGSSGAGGPISEDTLDIPGRSRAILPVMQVSEFRERLNQFLHRQNIRKLTAQERGLAREWCLDLIRREHPEFSEEQRERFYENLINIRIVAVDEWAQRMA